jgi:hypothetical protein
MPNWLRRVLPRETTEQIYHGARYDYDEGIRVEKPFRKITDGHLGARTLFMVCRTCNTGWMKKLQDQSIPILKPLIRGEWSDFTREHQIIISNWMAMTATVVAMSYPTKGVSDEDRRYIAAQRRPPRNWGIWIGRCTGFRGIDYGNRVVATFLTNGIMRIEQGHFVITTICLGQLILHSISAPLHEAVPSPVDYGINMGVYPINPRTTALPDWRGIPIIFARSIELARLRDAFYYSFDPNRGR